MDRAPFNPDYQGHGTRLRRAAEEITTRHLQRPQVLGIDPKLVIVFELEGDLDLEDFRRANLVVLDSSQEKVVVAFADDPQLQGFLERLDRYQSGPAEGRARPQLEGFFDVLKEPRNIRPEEKLTPRLLSEIDAVDPSHELRLDIECWHPGESEHALAQAWLDELTEAARTAGGNVADTYLNDIVGLSLCRAYLTAEKVAEIASLDQVARVDLLPRPHISPAQLYSIRAEDLPSMEQPLPATPLVGLIDSGVRSAHALLGPALEGVEVLSGLFPDGEDESGHGTRVAGLILHGPLDVALGRGVGLRPFCRLLSVRVLDGDSMFPANILWEKELEEAIRYCAEQGASVINLSIGDDESIYRAPRATPVAALLDQLARELQLVLVVSAGNVPVPDYATIDGDLPFQYWRDLHAREDTSLIDPAPSALALTVGGVCLTRAAGGLNRSEQAGLQPVGQEGWPSPFSRHGPGIAGAIKPELSAPGGSFALDPGIPALVDDAELAVISTGGGDLSTRDRLLEASVGTSLAAPLVTRVSAAVLARHPGISPNLVRALVLQSVSNPPFTAELEGGTEGERRNLVLDLVGYGSPAIDDAIESRDHRVVLVAEASIQVDGVHIYEVPIPSSFFESGGTRDVTVALAFDPPTRPRRLDYLASRMEFRLIRGIEPSDLERLVLAGADEGLEALDEEVATEGDDEEEAESEPSAAPQRLSDLSTRQLVGLQPSATRRAMGANQVGHKSYSTRLNRDHGESFLLVIKNTNRWAEARSMQNYAVAVCLSRDEGHPALYAELEAELRVAVELEVQG